MPEPNEILACGHPYILNETMVHNLPRCMKCAACCTCVPISKSFAEAAAKMTQAMADLNDTLRIVGVKMKADRDRKRTKADWQQLEGERNEH